MQQAFSYDQPSSSLSCLLFCEQTKLKSCRFFDSLFFHLSCMDFLRIMWNPFIARGSCKCEESHHQQWRILQNRVHCSHLIIGHKNHKSRSLQSYVKGSSQRLWSYYVSVYNNYSAKIQSEGNFDVKVIPENFYHLKLSDFNSKCRWIGNEPDHKQWRRYFPAVFRRRNHSNCQQKWE